MSWYFTASQFSFKVLIFFNMLLLFLSNPSITWRSYINYYALALFSVHHYYIWSPGLDQSIFLDVKTTEQFFVTIFYQLSWLMIIPLFFSFKSIVDNDPLYESGYIVVSLEVVNTRHFTDCTDQMACCLFLCSTYSLE